MAASTLVSKGDRPVIQPVEKSTIFTGDVTRLVQERLHPSQEQCKSMPPKGQNVSGRSWKVRPQKRASSLVKTSINRPVSSWEARKAAQRNTKAAKELQKEIKEQARQEALEKKERKLEQERRRAENQYQAAKRSVQTLNHSKVGVTLKALSKKQLRQIKKTRLNPKTGVVEFVSAYAK